MCIRDRVEVYKEPQDLVRRIQRGYVLIWSSSIIGGVLIYLGLFWIVRRGATMLASQQRRLVASETFAALGEMSSAVAHSLRNPLASIRSSAELAREFDEGAAHRNIDDIIGQVDRMSHWVRELLQSLRPLNDETEPVALDTTLRECLQAHAAQIIRAKVEVELDDLAGLHVLAQPVMLAQVFNSLLSNALEAMPDGGRLSVKVLSRELRLVSVRLIDTGKGMTTQQLRMAFKPFFTTKRGGLGVGLVLVRRIVERFGGTVKLGSREGQGTWVTVALRRVR